jgi:hypothetical protein
MDPAATCLPRGTGQVNLLAGQPLRHGAPAADEGSLRADDLHQARREPGVDEPEVERHRGRRSWGDGGAGVPDVKDDRPVEESLDGRDERLHGGATQIGEL